MCAASARRWRRSSRGSGVTVNVLCPGVTATNFFEVAGGALSGVADAADDDAPTRSRGSAIAGLARGERVTVAGLANRILAFAATHTPHFLTLPVAARLDRAGLNSPEETKMASDTYQIYAVRYAHHERRARENFLQGDPHDTAPMPLDYFVWAIVGESRTFVFDTGFDAAMADKREREFLRPPGDGLKAIGIDPATASRTSSSATCITTIPATTTSSPTRPTTCKTARWRSAPGAACATRNLRRSFEEDGCDGDDRPAVPRPGAVP